MDFSTPKTYRKRGETVFACHQVLALHEADHPRLVHADETRAFVLLVLFLSALNIGQQLLTCCHAFRDVRLLLNSLHFFFSIDNVITGIIVIVLHL